jgi:hypothetical protein
MGRSVESAICLPPLKFPLVSRVFVAVLGFSLLGLRAIRPRRDQRFLLGLVTISTKECASYLSARQVFSVWVARRVPAGDFSLLILVDSESRS